MTDEALLASLRERAQTEVGRVVKPGPVALLDFPDYGNPGDSAIWLGALACLSALGFDRPVYTSDQRTFDERVLRRALGSGTILLTGGGNFGDLWPRHQEFRERVVSAFPDHPIVQLPQSIHFDDPDALASARRVLSTHHDFTILVRDPKSLDVARSQLDCRAVLCPDLAFGLARETEPALREGPSRSRGDIVRLLRTDHEAHRDQLRGSNGPSVDWVDDVASPFRRFMSSYSSLARHRLHHGARLLQSARVVVTDRLHGHVLALLLGIPHVVFGDKNGKLRAFMDTWTSSATRLRWANTPGDADRLASELL